MNKKIFAAALATLMSLSGCSAADQADTENTALQESTAGWNAYENVDEMSAEEVYAAAREAVLYHAAYTPETYEAVYNAWISFDLMPTVSENLQKIKDQDEEALAAVEEMRTGLKNLIQTAAIEDVIFDIWEGHDQLPVPDAQDNNSLETAQACLADDEGFRPFISDYRLSDPSAAIGTLVVVPSVRGSNTELAQIAQIWNDMGYNVFTVEPRMNTVGDLGYAELNMDVQRSIRYIRYNASDLGIDADKIFTLGGSKGNFSHPMAYNFYDSTPNEYIESLGSTLKNYTPDEIDEVYSNVAVCVVNYGSKALAGFTADFSAKTITESKIYSEENYKNGLKFPDIYVTSGNLDSDTANVGSLITGLYEYNADEDKLYTIQYEMHVMEGIPHGFGAGKDYENLTEQWNEAGVFVRNALSDIE